jgi:hypothetical protein
VQEYDGDEILNVSSEFFSIDNSFFGDEDDNNYHYTNNSCILNQSFGEENQFEIICSYSIWYYANSENWKCEISLNDGLVNSSDNDEVFINPLLSIGVLESIDFGSLATQVFSDEVQIIVENKGNVLIDLALSGYGAQEGDGYAMICSGGENIGIENKKYSFNSFIGNLTLEDSEIFYNNLTSEPTITDFNLDFRKNDLEDNAINSTYWRIYVPSGSGGSCYGNIVLGAVMSE